MREHDDWIVAYAKRKTLGNEDAQDAAQVMRLAFLEACGAIDDGPDARTRTSLRMRMRGRLWTERRRPRWEALSGDVDPDDLCSGPIAEDVADARMLLERAGLTERQRFAVVALASGALASDIASECGCHQTVISRDIDRGMRQLRIAAGVSVEGEPGAAAERTVDRIVSLLRSAGPMTGPAIREALDVSEFVALRALRSLAKDGVVRSDGTPNRRMYTLVQGEDSGAA